MFVYMMNGKQQRTTTIYYEMTTKYETYDYERRTTTMYYELLQNTKHTITNAFLPIAFNIYVNGRTAKTRTITVLMQYDGKYV